MKIKTNIIIAAGILFIAYAAGMLAESTSARYTPGQVSLHDKASDCWVFVGDKVFNLTSVAAWHADVIRCGQNNTALYLQHHNTYSNIDPYYLGDIGAEAASCSYTYSSWGACQPNGTQARSVLTSLPAGCTGKPALTQPCSYANKSSASAGNSSGTAPGGYTAGQVMQHNTNSSCWVAVFSKVYDVTSQMPSYGYFYTCGADNSAKWRSSIFGNDTTILAPYLLGSLTGTGSLPEAEAKAQEAIPKQQAAQENHTVQDSSQEAASQSYTLDDVGRHSTDSDCWIAILGKAYDITGLVASHSGGDIFSCGTDMTGVFVGRHGSDLSRMEPYLKGTIAGASQAPVVVVDHAETDRLKQRVSELEDEISRNSDYLDQYSNYTQDEIDLLLEQIRSLESRIRDLEQVQEEQKGQLEKAQWLESDDDSDGVKNKDDLFIGQDDSRALADLGVECTGPGCGIQENDTVPVPKAGEGLAGQIRPKLSFMAGMLKLIGIMG